MNKIYRILGRKGRITIPYEMRVKLGFAYNDVLSFENTDKGVIVKREKWNVNTKLDTKMKDKISTFTNVQA